MKIKLLLIASIIIVFSLRGQAQETRGRDDILMSRMKYALAGIGTSVENIMGSATEFKRVAEEPYILYRYSRDTAVYIGFQKGEVSRVAQVFVYLPKSYSGTVTAFLSSLNFKLVDDADDTGSATYRNEGYTIYLQKHSEEGTIDLTMIQTF